MTYMIKTAAGWRPFLALNVPCPNSNDLQGVYRPEPIEVVQKKYESRLTRFLAANGIQNRMEKMHYFRGDSFIEPIHGAFGEKL